jgi:microsomal dipeptidase-like Zn-dependent dipeptidase
MLGPIKMTVEQMKEAARLGALVEFVYNGLIGKSREFSVEQYASAIRAVGPEHCVLASDLGQAANPLPADGLRTFIDALRDCGLTEQELARMTVHNPAKVLGLAVK